MNIDELDIFYRYFAESVGKLNSRIIQSIKEGKRCPCQNNGHCEGIEHDEQRVVQIKDICPYINGINCDYTDYEEGDVFIWN